MWSKKETCTGTATFCGFKEQRMNLTDFHRLIDLLSRNYSGECVGVFLGTGKVKSFYLSKISGKVKVFI